MRSDPASPRRCRFVRGFKNTRPALFAGPPTRPPTKLRSRNREKNSLAIEKPSPPSNPPCRHRQPSSFAVSSLSLPPSSVRRPLPAVPPLSPRCLRAVRPVRPPRSFSLFLPNLPPHSFATCNRKRVQGKGPPPCRAARRCPGARETSGNRRNNRPDRIAGPRVSGSTWK